MSFDYGKYFGEITLTHDLLTQEDGALVAAQAATRWRASRHRPLPGLQRAPDLAHGPDGDRHLRSARPRLRRRRRADVLLRHPAPPPRPDRLRRALRQPHGRVAPEDGAARGRHVVSLVHPVLRRGAPGRSALPEAPHRRVSRRAAGARRFRVHPACRRHCCPPLPPGHPAPAARGACRSPAAGVGAGHQGRRVRARSALGPDVHPGSPGGTGAGGVAADGARRHRSGARGRRHAPGRHLSRMPP